MKILKLFLLPITITGMFIAYLIVYNECKDKPHFYDVLWDYLTDQ